MVARKHNLLTESGNAEFKLLLSVHKSFSVIFDTYYLLVNTKVKVMPKKRKHQVSLNLLFTLSKASILNYLSKASILKYQVLWYSTLITFYMWFLYWICSDFFVLHKPFVEINLVNFVGSIATLACIWAGTKLWKHGQSKAESPQQESLPRKQIQKEPPQKDAALTAVIPAESTCSHYLGYLNQRQKQQEILAECLICTNLLKCMDSTN